MERKISSASALLTTRDNSCGNGRKSVGKNFVSVTRVIVVGGRTVEHQHTDMFTTLLRNRWGTSRRAQEIRNPGWVPHQAKTGRGL
jgi:hypothetical protein